MLLLGFSLSLVGLVFSVFGLFFGPSGTLWQWVIMFCVNYVGSVVFAFFFFYFQYREM